MAKRSFLRFDNANKKEQILSQSSQEKQVNWKHTAPNIMTTCEIYTFSREK